MENLAQISIDRTEGAKLAMLDLYETVCDAVRGAAQEVKERIPYLYYQALAADYFTGGWCEKPEFPREDYAAYERWVSNKDLSLPRGSREKFALIGANRLWKLHEDLASHVADSVKDSLEKVFPGQGYGALSKTIYDLGLVNSGVISIEDGPRISAQYQYHDGSGFTYDYKIIHIKDEEKDFRLRAVSTHEFSGSLNDVSIRDNAKAQKDLLDYYRIIDAAIRNGTPIYYGVDAVFSVERLAYQHSQRLNAVMAAMFC